jgi:hypothetical protein
MKTSWERRARLLLSLFASFVIGASRAWAGAYLAKSAGIVQIRRAGTQRWDLLKDVSVDLSNEDSIRTGQGAQAVVVFKDGSHLELGPKSELTLQEAGGARSASRLDLGSLRAIVEKQGDRRFEVLTPSAVCLVRSGTEFRVEALVGGRTKVDLSKGLVEVEDKRGQQILLHPNERLEVDLRGIGKPDAKPTPAQQTRADFHELMRREMGIDRAKFQVMAQATREIKTAVFQQGMASIDASGDRVRVEDFILRPAPNEFKIVVLNSSKNGGFDYFTYLGIFNTNLPPDLSIALNELPGTVGAPPAYYLTGFQTVRSNTSDSIVQTASGGHPVDVNFNGDPQSAVTTLFNPATNSYINVAGLHVYQTLFDNYGLYVDGALKYGWFGNNIQSYYTVFPPTPASTNDPFTGAALGTPLPSQSVNTTFPSGGQAHQVVYQSYSDGTFIQWDNYAFNGQRQIATAAQFQSPTGYLSLNNEQVITATEFQGRSIDLIIGPRISVQTGIPPWFSR